MSHDEIIILDLDRETQIQINPIPIMDVTMGLLESSIVVNIQPDVYLIIDLESMNSDSGSVPYRLYGRVARPMLFTKAVLASKKTFGRSNFVVTNNIQTIGTADIDSANHNIIRVPITFAKVVSGYKTTFGKTSFAIINNIQTIAGGISGDINFYGSGLYGVNTYSAPIQGYGSGVYGVGNYAGLGISFAIGFRATTAGHTSVRETAVSEISLASHAIPAVRTSHSIRVRARTVSGANGVIKAALYEGAVNRSGDLISASLSNTLTDYVLNISDVAAAAITNYSNLSIKIWGYDSSGSGLVFEISEVYLELPIGTGSISYGSVSRQITFGKSVSGVISSKATSVAEISLASHGIPYERTNHSVRVRARTVSGSNGVLKAELYEGTTNISGELISGPLTNVLTDYTLVIFDEIAATIIDYSNLSIKFFGFDYIGTGLVFEISEVYLELPVSTGNTTQYGTVSRGITFTKTVSGIVSSRKTSIAELSLASHSTPAESTNHSIKVRARTISGSTGVLKAELYEGSTLRSGSIPLVTSLLTTSLTEYTLDIPDAAAATITDYSNLSIKFWGFDTVGNALVFEVTEIYLELPVSSGITTHYGSVSGVTTFTKAVSGIISSKKTSIVEISLASHGTPSERTNHSIKVRARTTSGSTGVLKVELYEGSTLRSGVTPLVTSSLTTSLVDYTLAISDAAAATITDYSNLSIKFWGFDSAGNALVFEVSRLYLELPTT